MVIICSRSCCFFVFLKNKQLLKQKVLWNQGVRRLLLLDFIAPVGEVIQYLAVKLGAQNFQCLNLHVYGSSEVLRHDRTLVQQGITPNYRLFCVTGQKDELPLFPRCALVSLFFLCVCLHLHANPHPPPSDAVSQYALPVTGAQLQDDSNFLLNVSEESLTRATKRGVLQKLNAKRSKYSPRFFVLQDGDLYYFMDAKAPRAKNVLQDAIAAVVPLDEDGKKGKKKAEFEFIVSAVNKKVRLMAKSAEEGIAWVNAINGSAASRSSGRIFRNTLQAAVKKQDGTEIPDIVSRCLEYLDRQSVLRTVGLFRLSGSAPVIKKLSDDIDSGKGVDFSLIADTHTVTGLLKLYFREMSEPLLTWALFGPLTVACAVTDTCRSDRVRYVKQLLKQLPPLNFATLAALMKFLAKVARHAEYNKMPLHNVATVFAPNILRKKDASMFEMVELSPLVNNAVITILEYEDHLFGGGPFPVQSEFPVRAIACAHAAYTPAPSVVGDLTLAEGDIVSVLAEAADGWWYGESAGVYGRFPGSYVAKLDEKEAEKQRKKAKIDVKIQEMREQAEHRDKVLARLRSQRAELKGDIKALKKERKQLKQSNFSGKASQIASTMPQFSTVATQYREALQKMLMQTEQSTGLRQELLIALNALVAAANNPKLAKKYKKVLVKIEPLLVTVRESIQKTILLKFQNADIRSDLIKDLIEIDRVISKK